ncbi:MAG: hypothetical protein JNK09_10895 [Prolixibacteraceae bacterium]|nr:hypothetical protein [Prolixibacteraceae bacterium]
MQKRRITSHCWFVSLSLERDLADFTAYSPLFDAAYLAAYNAKVTAAQELVQPYAETVEGKIITEHTDTIFQELITLINRLEGYISLASASIAMSPADFGFLQLRKKLRTRDVEAVLSLIRPIENNIERFKAELGAKGMTPEFAAKFTQASASLAEDKRKRYTMISNRAALVQNNMNQLNDLYAQMTEICTIGKILYKQTDKAKQNDYTIAFLLKQVHRTFKSEEKAAKQAAKSGTSENSSTEQE